MFRRGTLYGKTLLQKSQYPITLRLYLYHLSFRVVTAFMSSILATCSSDCSLICERSCLFPAFMSSILVDCSVFAAFMSAISVDCSSTLERRSLSFETSSLFSASFLALSSLLSASMFAANKYSRQTRPKQT